MKLGRKLKKNIRFILKKILPGYFYNLIIFFLIRKKFINSYNANKLYSVNYVNKNNKIREYKISSQNYEDGIIKSLILKLKKSNKKLNFWVDKNEDKYGIEFSIFIYDFFGMDVKIFF